jgi:hypothetical protein
MTKHNLIHLFPEIDCASQATRPASAAPGNEARPFPSDESPDDGIVRAGLLYMAGDLAELCKIASADRARELRALSQLMRALAAS